MNDPGFVTDRLFDEVGPYITRQPGASSADTPLERVTVWSSTQATPPVPALFQPMFYVVLQGVKVLTLGQNRFDLSAGECVATSFGLPFVAHLEKATPSTPYVAIRLDLDVDLLVDVMLDMPKAEDRWVCSASLGKLEGAVEEAFVRLIRLMSATEDQPMLRRQHERELYYRLLQSPMGDTLRQLGQRDNRLRRIKAAADWLCANATKAIVISELAATAGMSLTSFHRHFKAVTGHSPLAFQRQMRLMEARKLLATGADSVSQVAFAMGYVSPSQFSREYKAMFGAPPTADLTRIGKRSA